MATIDWNDMADLERFHTLDYNPHQGVGGDHEDEELIPRPNSDDSFPTDEPDALGCPLPAPRTGFTSSANTLPRRALEPFHHRDLKIFNFRHVQMEKWRNALDCLTLEAAQERINLQCHLKLLIDSARAYRNILSSMRSTRCPRRIKWFRKMATIEYMNILDREAQLLLAHNSTIHFRPFSLSSPVLELLDKPGDGALNAFMKRLKHRPSTIVADKYDRAIVSYRCLIHELNTRIIKDELDLAQRLKLYDMAVDVASHTFGNSLKKLKNLSSPIALQMFNVSTVCNLDSLHMDMARIDWRKGPGEQEWRMKPDQDDISKALKGWLQSFEREQWNGRAPSDNNIQTGVQTHPNAATTLQYLSIASKIVARNVWTMQKLKLGGPLCRKCFCSSTKKDVSEHPCYRKEPCLLDLEELLRLQQEFRKDFDSDMEELDNDAEEFDSDMEEIDSDTEELDSDMEELDSDMDGTETAGTPPIGLSPPFGFNFVNIKLGSWSFNRRDLCRFLEQCPKITSLHLHNCTLVNDIAAAPDAAATANYISGFRHRNLRKLTASMTMLYPAEFHRAFKKIQDSTLPRRPKDCKGATGEQIDAMDRLRVLYPPLFIHFPNLRTWTVSPGPHNSRMVYWIDSAVRDFCSKVSYLILEKDALTPTEAAFLIRTFRRHPPSSANPERLCKIRVHPSYKCEEVYDALGSERMKWCSDFDLVDLEWPDYERYVLGNDSEEQWPSDSEGTGDSSRGDRNDDGNDGDRGDEAENADNEQDDDQEDEDEDEDETEEEKEEEEEDEEDEDEDEDDDDDEEEESDGEADRYDDDDDDDDSDGYINTEALKGFSAAKTRPPATLYYSPPPLEGESLPLESESHAAQIPTDKPDQATTPGSISYTDPSSELSKDMNWSTNARVGSGEQEVDRAFQSILQDYVASLIGENTYNPESVMEPERATTTAATAADRRNVIRQLRRIESLRYIWMDASQELYVIPRELRLWSTSPANWRTLFLSLDVDRAVEGSSSGCSSSLAPANGLTNAEDGNSSSSSHSSTNDDDEISGSSNSSTDDSNKAGAETDERGTRSCPIVIDDDSDESEDDSEDDSEDIEDDSETTIGDEAKKKHAADKVKRKRKRESGPEEWQEASSADRSSDNEEPE
ncbi:hypothetical protein BGX34_007506, partial [Mortierella sp. NVP85]